MWFLAWDLFLDFLVLSVTMILFPRFLCVFYVYIYVYTSESVLLPGPSLTPWLLCFLMVFLNLFCNTSILSQKSTLIFSPTGASSPEHPQQQITHITLTFHGLAVNFFYIWLFFFQSGLIRKLPSNESSLMLYPPHRFFSHPIAIVLLFFFFRQAPSPRDLGTAYDQFPIFCKGSQIKNMCGNLWPENLISPAMFTIIQYFFLVVRPKLKPFPNPNTQNFTIFSYFFKGLCDFSIYSAICVVFFSLFNGPAEWSGVICPLSHDPSMHMHALHAWQIRVQNPDGGFT